MAISLTDAQLERASSQLRARLKVALAELDRKMRSGMLGHAPAWT